MDKGTAARVIQGAMAAHVPNERINSAGELNVSGSVRHLADKQTFYASAIPIPAKNAYAFEVSHSGTLFAGPSIASRIYRAVLQRADAVGQKVSIR